MANGKKAEISYAACPREIPLGTMIEIEGLGTYECGDRTAEWVDGRYDLFTGYGQEAYDQAINNGIQYKKVTIK